MRLLRYATTVLVCAGLCVSHHAMPQTQTAQSDTTSVARDGDEPDPLAIPYLGTWMYTDHAQKPHEAEPAEINRYLLIRWDSGRFQVRTVEYYTKVRARGRESDWGGRIMENSWDVTRQTFKLRPDGSMDVTIHGTSSIFGNNPRSWWAVGKITVETEGEEPVLRYVTTKGHIPSSKGNLWRPWDRTYKLVSRELDERLSHYRP